MLERLRTARRLKAEVARQENLRFHVYAEDPVGFTTAVLGEFPWSKQREIMESVRDNRYTAVRSCHDAGKSYTASRIAAWWIASHPIGDAFVVSTAPTFSQVRSILWREINQAHKRGGLPGRINQTSWWMSDEIVAFGRKPADYDADAFQGIHARNVLVLIDEACGVPRALWDAADTLVTNEGSRMLAIGNPDDPTSQFATVCKPNSGWHMIHIDGFDTPNFTDEKIPEKLRPLLLSKLWVEERRQRWGEGSALWTAKVRGIFPEMADDTLIPLAWVERAVEREMEATAPSLLAVDVARGGADETVIGLRRGPVFTIFESYHNRDTMETTGRIVEALRATESDVAKVDSVGLGAGVADRLEELGAPVFRMSAGSRAQDPQRFANLRAEWYWQLRELFEHDLIDIPADEILMEQLCAIRYKIDSRGRTIIEGKDDMRRRGIGSPDRADTLMMAFGEIEFHEEYIVEWDDRVMIDSEY